MLYSYRIEQAIRAASILHKDHVQKTSAPYPYVAHLFAVACIIADYTKDEDVIIAGLLHDTLAETDYTAKELETDFGARVREIVTQLTLPEKAPQESLMVLAADAIHTLRSIVEEYQPNITLYATSLSGNLEEELALHKKKSLIFNARLTNPIIHEFNHVFDAYTKFIRFEI